MTQAERAFRFLEESEVLKDKEYSLVQLIGLLKELVGEEHIFQVAHFIRCQVEGRTK